MRRHLPASSQRQRPGVALLIVITILTIIAIVGVAFVYFSDAQQISARYFKDTSYERFRSETRNEDDADRSTSSNDSAQGNEGSQFESEQKTDVDDKDDPDKVRRETVAKVKSSDSANAPDTGLRILNNLETGWRLTNDSTPNVDFLIQFPKFELSLDKPGEEYSFDIRLPSRVGFDWGFTSTLDQDGFLRITDERGEFNPNDLIIVDNQILGIQPLTIPLTVDSSDPFIVPLQFEHSINGQVFQPVPEPSSVLVWVIVFGGLFVFTWRTRHASRSKPLP